MKEFEYFTPTRVIFGKKTEERTGELVAEQKCTKVLIHYGSGSVIRSGLLARVKASLDEKHIEYVELGGVVPNPRLSKVREGVELAKREKVDFVLAVGGGSAIDSAKAICYGALYDGDVWDFYARKGIAAVRALPLGVVLTIAATGSEMSSSSVITNEDGWIKRGYRNDLSRPVFAIMNPELTMTLPDYQTACGATDIWMHTMERYFCSGTTMEITDSIAEALMRTVIKYGRILAHDPQNYEARAEIMWAGSLSHNNLTQCGNDNTDWSTHSMEHEIGGMFDVAHGAGLAAVWGSWARYVYNSSPEAHARFEKFARNVCGINCRCEDVDIALKGIDYMEEWFIELGMPVSIKQLGIDPTDEDLVLMSEKWEASNGKKGGVKTLYRDDILNIYRMANK